MHTKVETVFPDEVALEDSIPAPSSPGLSGNYSEAVQTHEERDGHQKSLPTMNWVNQFVTVSDHQFITHPGTSLCHMDTKQ